MSEKNLIITYQGTQISMFSDERNDYINITDMAKAWKNYGRKSIAKWLRNKQTLEFLAVWEKKHNPEFDGTQIGAVLQLVKNPNFTLSVDFWRKTTMAKGIFTREGTHSGTYAHKDIAIRFGGWLSPEFELYLVEEIQRLKTLEEKVNSLDLLNEEQILYIIELKDIFKFVSNQGVVEKAHQDVFAAHSDAKNPWAEFHKWRNKILDIEPETINEKIREYCNAKGIALTTKLLNKDKKDKLIILDSYETVKHAVWDFLKMKGEVNALKFAKLAERIIRQENGEVVRNNETDLFHKKQDLGFTDFNKQIDGMHEVKSARQILAYREESKKKIENPSKFNQKLLQALNHKPKEQNYELN